MAEPLMIYKYVFPIIESNMYVIIDGNAALVIDPIISTEALCLLENAEVSDVLILLTHEHYDHTAGAPALMERFFCRIICQQSCAQKIRKSRHNRPIIFTVFSNDRNTRIETFNSLPQLYMIQADRTFDIKMKLVWKGHNIRLVSTPGHSPGSCCIELDDEYIFSGDSLLCRTPVITRFPEGNAADFLSVTKSYLQSLPPHYKVMPGHGTCFNMQEVDWPLIE